MTKNGGQAKANSFMNGGRRRKKLWGQVTLPVVTKDPELVKQLEYFRKLLSGLKRPEQMTERERLEMSK